MYDDDTQRNGWREYFAPLFQARTYGNLLYLVLSLPLGVLYFTVLVAGYAVGITLIIILIGLPILLVTQAVADMFLRWERSLANRLLGTDIPVRPRRKHRRGCLSGTQAVLTDPLVWRGHIFLVAKFAFGIAAQIILSVAWVIPLMLILAPIQDPEISGPLALIPMAIGLGLAPLSAHASNQLIDWWRLFVINTLAERDNRVAIPKRDPSRMTVPQDDPYDDLWEEDPAYYEDYEEKPKRKAKTLSELLGDE